MCELTYADLAMSKGIAKVIYDRFLDRQKISALERQDKGVGDVAVALIGQRRYVLYVLKSMCVWE